MRWAQRATVGMSQNVFLSNPMDDCVVVVSLNCQGLGNRQKRKDVFYYLTNKKCSSFFFFFLSLFFFFFFFFCKTPIFLPKMDNFISTEWGYESYFSSYNSNSRGLAILFNNNFEFKVKDIDKGDRGSYIILTVRIKEIDILLVNLYGPNRDEPEFYNTLMEKIMELDNPNVIMAGDRNMMLDIF